MMDDDDAGAEGKVKALDSWGRAQKYYRQKVAGEVGRKIGHKMDWEARFFGFDHSPGVKISMRIQP